MNPFEKLWLVAMGIGVLMGVCTQNLCLTLGCGFGLVAVCSRKWEK